MTTEYASAVAAVRAMESSLLVQSDIERMTAAGSIEEISDILVSCSRSAVSDKDKLITALETELDQVWSFLHDYAPNHKTLEILLYRNNFHNLKATLKALIMNTDAKRLFIRPSTLDLDALPEIVASKQYDVLPVYMRETAQEAYGILTRTLDGQLTDAVIDRAALEAMQNEANRLKSGFMQKYAQLTTVCADIQTAYRCSRMQKSESFLETAICGSPELDKNSLIREALKGTDALLSWLEGTSYNEAAELISSSSAQFEKWCDDALIALAEEAKLKAFGIEPLAAYYIAKEMEIKNLRILIVCKSCGASRETIIERMRRLYV